MKSRIVRIAITLVAMVLCAVVAVLLPPLWSGVGGREFRPQATAMAVCIFAFAIAARRGLWWTPWDFVIGVLPVEFLILLAIASFGGSTGAQILDEFNLHWLAFMNLFTALPWFAGLLIGSVWLRVRTSSGGRNAA